MNEDNSWIIIPIMLAGMGIVVLVGGLLLEFLPRQWSISPILFGAGTILTTVIVTAAIMVIAITQLGCC